MCPPGASFSAYTASPGAGDFYPCDPARTAKYALDARVKKAVGQLRAEYESTPGFRTVYAGQGAAAPYLVLELDATSATIKAAKQLNDSKKTQDGLEVATYVVFSDGRKIQPNFTTSWLA
jgi:hypothetical protein